MFVGDPGIQDERRGPKRVMAQVAGGLASTGPSMFEVIITEEQRH